MIDRYKSGLWYLVVLMFLLGGVGCDGRAKQDGEQGNLRFYYMPADKATRFDRPLAVGSGMVLRLEAVGKRELERVVEVRVEPAGVFNASVDQEDGRSIIISGQKAGRAKIIVDVQGGGESYSDSTTLSVDRPSQASLAHMCTGEVNAGYFVGEPVHLNLKRYSSGGEMLVGSARSTADPGRGCQVEISPEEFQQAARCDEAGLVLDPVGQTGPMRVRLAEGVGRYSGSKSELGVQLVTSDLLDFEPIYEELQVDYSRRVQLYPITYGQNWPICTDMWMRVYIETPRTCTGENGEYEFDVEPADQNGFSLRGVREGYCEFAVEVFGQEPMEFLFDMYVER